MEVISTYACRIDGLGHVIEIGGRLSSAAGITLSSGVERLSFPEFVSQGNEASHIRAAFNEGKSMILGGVIDTVLPTPSGKIRRIRWILSPFEAENGTPGYIAMGWPEEDWERMNRQLVNMGRIVEMSIEAVAIISARGFIEYVNPAFCTTTGYNPCEVIGRPVSNLVSVPEDISVMQQALECFRRGVMWEGRLKMHRKNGSAIFISVRITPIEDGPGAARRYIVVAADLSLQHSLERRVEELQRLESLGTLSNGIAHRFNNILASVSGQAELLIMSSKDPAVKQRAEKILESALKGKEVVEQLGLFGRKSESRTRPSDLAPIVRNAVKFIRAAQPRCVNIVEDMPEKTSEVLANTGEIHQIMVNLLTNSLEAIGSKQGTIIVHVYEDILGLKSDGPRQKCVVIEVCDSGVGIDPAIRHRIFEPFFTTRGLANASGMGLAVTYGIVQRHGGKVSFESEPGKGATFRVFLPVYGEISDSANSVGAVEFKENILFADEKGFSIESGKRVLEDLRYRVTALSDLAGIEQVLQDRSQTYSLFITSLHMGGREGGLGLCRASRRSRPEMPVLLCLDIRENFDDEKAIDAGASAVLRRPVSREQLGDIVSRLVQCNR
jgi:PAS domain S-box-containing protein